MFKHATRTTAKSESFAAADEAEITNIELQVSTDDLLSWEETARVAKEAGFGYVVKFPTSLDVPAEAIENCVLLCAALKTDTLVIHEPMFKKFGARIAELAPGLNVAVEKMTGDKEDAGFYIGDKPRSLVASIDANEFKLEGNLSINTTIGKTLFRDISRMA